MPMSTFFYGHLGEPLSHSKLGFTGVFSSESMLEKGWFRVRLGDFILQADDML